MAEMSASAILGLKLDSIPFSAFHVAVILVLGLVGFIDGYDLALTGSLLVLASNPAVISLVKIVVLRQFRHRRALTLAQNA